ncbi:MAG TPA: NADH-quinone oxidoreductase subunit J [Thiotrichales bacterium]|nr:NADH-quinone oxidoreductase subunit J [Thiotrichales bacterium]
MSFERILFYLFAAILVFAALRVISSRNPVHSALFLVLAFFTSSALWILLEAEFLAITLVLVYVGAVMVLFLFVVMMLDINFAPLREGFTRYLPLGAVVALVIVAEIVLVLLRGFDTLSGGAPAPKPADYSNTRAIGEVLYTDYLLPFEIASVILLVAIIAAIALTLRKRPGTRHQDPGKQVQVRKSDRLRIVEMKAEPRAGRAES